MRSWLWRGPADRLTAVRAGAHSFWENPEVRQAIYSMLRWWLDRGVDGFRMDVINLMSKDPDLPDGSVPPGETLSPGLGYFTDGPRIREFLHEVHQEVLAGRDTVCLTVGGMPGTPVEQARLYTDPAPRST